MGTKSKTYGDFIEEFMAKVGTDLFKKGRFSDVEMALDAYVAGLVTVDAIDNGVRLKEMFFRDRLPPLIGTHLFAKHADDSGFEKWIIDLPKLVKGGHAAFTADIKPSERLSRYLLVSLRHRVPLVGIISDLAQAIDAFVEAYPEFQR